VRFRRGRSEAEGLMVMRVAVGFLLLGAVLVGQQRIPIAPANLALDGVLASTVTHAGREALRLIEADDKRGGGMAIVNGQTFRDGTIEVDVAGRRGPHAVPSDRGFVGVVFRLSADRGKSEYIYLRPDNGRAPDQVQRNHSIQYSSHPDFPWPRMRKEFPEKYESYVDLEPGVWTRMRIEVSGTTARLYVHDNTQPNLIVNDLKHGLSEGSVALWIGAGSEAFFSNLRITIR
jgi:hypothetical protein